MTDDGSGFRLGERVRVSDGGLSFTGIYVGLIVGLPRVRTEEGDVLTGAIDCMESLEPWPKDNDVNSDPDLVEDDLLEIPLSLRRTVNVRGKTIGARRAAPAPLIAPPPGRAWKQATEWQIWIGSDDLGLPTGQRKALVIVGQKKVRLWMAGEYGQITRTAWDSIKKRPWVEVAECSDYLLDHI